MPRFAFPLFKDVPPRFVAMEQLLAHLALPQRLHDRLKQGREFPPPLGHRALGERHPMMLQRLAEAGGGTAVEIFI
jgi:hypothetical protein